MSENNELLQYIQSDDVFQKVKLLNGKSIGIKAWKIKQENQLLFSIETNSDEKGFVVEQCIQLIRKCVDNKELFDSLSRNVLLDLLVKVRKISKGETIEITYRCNNVDCSTFVKFPEEVQKVRGRIGQSNIELNGMIDLNSDIDSEPFDDTPVELPRFIFRFSESPYLHQRELEDELLFGEKPQLNKFNYELLLSSIFEIEVKTAEENKVISGFDRNILETFIDTLSTAEYTELLSGFVEKISKFELKKEVGCPSCGKSQEILYDNIFSLLVF